MLGITREEPGLAMGTGDKGWIWATETRDEQQRLGMGDRSWEWATWAGNGRQRLGMGDIDWK